MTWEIIIIGAGPAGLSAALFTRMRRMTTLLLDTAVAGGQLASLYPKKPVHDFPSYTYVMGDALGRNFVDQANHMGAEIHEGEHVTMIERDDAADLIRVVSTKGTYEAKAVIVATGGGAFEPRKIKKPGEAEFKDRGVTYGMPDVELCRGKRVLVVGGGDSALEAAISLKEVADVTLIHMLDKWQGMDGYVEEVRESPRIRALLETETVEIRGDAGPAGVVRSVLVKNKKTGAEEAIPTDLVAINIGYLMDTKIVRQWGLELEGNQIKTDNRMHTNVKGVLSCGDIATYPGKYKLLITACSEGAAAANSAYIYVRQPKKFTVGELYAAPKDDVDPKPDPTTA
ncbi:MAG TPA: NAD(P)/FAD-dependent oxidoreductase [Candidatus Eisenbacteria bacterium]|nr:NAD(P)/FAD-dependent oxidoreductase [Candidatus Eisenbacteria bacterium]